MHVHIHHVTTGCSSDDSNNPPITDLYQLIAQHPFLNQRYSFVADVSIFSPPRPRPRLPLLQVGKLRVSTERSTHNALCGENPPATEFPPGRSTVSRRFFDAEIKKALDTVANAKICARSLSIPVKSHLYQECAHPNRQTFERLAWASL